MGEGSTCARSVRIDENNETKADGELRQDSNMKPEQTSDDATNVLAEKTEHFFKMKFLEQLQSLAMLPYKQTPDPAA